MDGIAVYTRPGYQAITIDPSYQDTDDLEAATRSITATSRPAGADYSASLTPPAPPDSRAAFLNTGIRLLLTVDSLAGGAALLSYEVKNATTGQVLLSGTHGAAGQKIDGANITTSGKVTLGSANTLEFRFWVDAGSAVISQVQLQVAAGGKYGTNTSPGGGSSATPATITHQGLMLLPVAITWRRLGTGTRVSWYTLKPGAGTTAGGEYQHQFSGTQATHVKAAGTHTLACHSDVATDLCYWANSTLVLEVR